MPNQNGTVYGLTILSPIIEDDKATPSHDLQIRQHLSTLPTGQDSPFARVAGTHLARLVVMDDVVYVGMPACEEHLNSKYLIFESNIDCPDGNIDGYFRAMAASARAEFDAVWSHCVGYPGASNGDAFVTYMKACQIKTTFFFAAVNDKSLPQSLKALQTQTAVADFIASHQGMEPAKLQAEFVAFAEQLKNAPVPPAGSMGPHRLIKTGGHNE